ncbi:MAG: hypothetical protein A4E55_00546 [Pelotomaculum sp. PtaU1.Bin035]|nr:MAG: hypothetical protein A4E55_00546 [Pelotomaculum sp. PtaU1.Bin035]
MPKLTQGELLNNVFKEAAHREKQREALFAHLSKTVRDTRLKAMFNDLARSSREHFKQLTGEMNNFNIKP